MYESKKFIISGIDNTGGDAKEDRGEKFRKAVKAATDADALIRAEKHGENGVSIELNGQCVALLALHGALTKAIMDVLDKDAPHFKRAFEMMLLDTIRNEVDKEMGNDPEDE